MGFSEARTDTSLFIYRCSTDTVYLLLYIDDIVLTASSDQLLRRIIDALKTEFAIKDLGPLHISSAWLFNTEVTLCFSLSSYIPWTYWIAMA